MGIKHIIRALIISAIVLINVGCDQVSKHIVRKNLNTQEVIQVVKSNFVLMKVENTGAAMSSGANLPPIIKIVLLQIFPSLILLFMFIWILTNTKFSKILIIGLCFIIGGGIGNIYDRILYGSVTDFMYMELGFLKTGIFNMADVSVSLGTILILFELLHRRKNTRKEPSLLNR